MAAQIGIIGNTVGEVFAKSPNGSLRRLNSGDPVFEKDVIVTSNGSSAEVIQDIGTIINITEQQSISMTDDVIGNADKSDSSVMKETLQQLIKTENFNQLIEEDAAAAGLIGGEQGDGHNFVDIMRIIENVDNNTYDFPVNPIGSPPEIKGLSAPEAQTSIVTPPPIDPVPPVEPSIDPVPPTVTVDLEVDPNAEKLVGTSTNADSISVTVVGSDGSSHTYAAIINQDGTWSVDVSTEVYNKDVTYTATATATNNDDTDIASDVDSYTVIVPPPVEPPIDPVSPVAENWFISHQGNSNFDQSKSISETQSETFNVQFQDRSGEHIGIVHANDVVDVKINVTGSSLNLLDILDVSPSKEFSATWSIDNGVLDVLLTNISGKDANLQGNPFDVKFDVKADSVTGTSGSLTFDIQSATVGGVWESNDQANYVITDLIKTTGNHHP